MVLADASLRHLCPYCLGSRFRHPPVVVLLLLFIISWYFHGALPRFGYCFPLCILVLLLSFNSGAVVLVFSCPVHFPPSWFVGLMFFSALFHLRFCLFFWLVTLAVHRWGRSVGLGIGAPLSTPFFRAPLCAVLAFSYCYLCSLLAVASLVSCLLLSPRTEGGKRAIPCVSWHLAAVAQPLPTAPSSLSAPSTAPLGRCSPAVYRCSCLPRLPSLAHWYVAPAIHLRSARPPLSFPTPVRPDPFALYPLPPSPLFPFSLHFSPTVFYCGALPPFGTA